MPVSNNTQGIARIVKLKLDEPGDTHVGMAFIAGARHVITCCHVLNDALGRENRLDTEKPPSDTQFSIRFPYADDARGFGVVVKWGLALSGAKDIVVLKLEEDAPSGAGVAVFSKAEVQREKWFCIGWDANGVDREAHGEFGSILARDERQLNGPAGVAARIAGGYSGAVVWSDVLEAFVGMVVTRDRDQIENGLAYAIPTRVLSEFWPLQCAVGKLIDVPSLPPHFLSRTDRL